MKETHRISCSRCGWASKEYSTFEAAVAAHTKAGYPVAQCPRCNAQAAHVLPYHEVTPEKTDA